MTQYVSDCLRIMRLAIGRRNENDPDSSDTTLRTYLNDFISLTMSDDLKVFEQFGTLKFTIDDTNETGVYALSDVMAENSIDFTNLSTEAFVTLTDPPAGSISWNRLDIYQDPGLFFSRWGVNNEDVLIAGYPTEMLYYGTDLTFRTIPDTEYTIYIYGYKVVPAFSDDGNDPLPQDYWLRYLAYGAALNYARDYRFEADALNQLKVEFAHERKLLLTRVHNQRKLSRCQPRF